MDDTDTTIYDLYDQYDDGTDEVAKAILDVVIDNPDLLLPVLARDIAIWRRNRTRRVERAFIASVEDEETDDAEPKARRAVKVAKRQPLDDLLTETFFTGKRHVPYSEATVQDYQDSIEHLNVKVNGINTTIHTRQVCIDLIQSKRGAKTLSDLSPKDLAKALDLLRGAA